VFENLKARLEKLLADHTRAADPRTRVAALHAAVLEAKVGVGTLRDGVGRTERELARERQALADAERRGTLARGIQDEETVRVAERFAARHRERITVLERKLAVQREELALAERDLEAMTAELRKARQGMGEGRNSAEAAWRDLEAAGGTRPETDLDAERLARELDRRRREEAVEAQLEHLKKRMGKEDSR
jgi:hypothetical protein